MAPPNNKYVTVPSVYSNNDPTYGDSYYYDENGNKVFGYSQAPTYSFWDQTGDFFTNTIPNSLTSLGNSVGGFFGFGGSSGGSGSGSGNILSDIWKWGSSPMGTGKNATTPFGLLVPAITAGYGIYSQNQQAKDAFNLAKEAANRDWGLKQLNVLQNTAILAKNMQDQTQGRVEFNPNSALNYVNSAENAFKQVVDAGQLAGIDRSRYSNSLKGFNDLRNSLA